MLWQVCERYDLLSVNKPEEALAVSKEIMHFSYSKLNLGSYKQADHHSQKTLFDFFCVHNQKLEAYLGMEFGWNHKL